MGRIRIPIYSIASVVAVGLVWWAVTFVHAVPQFLLPSPGDVLRDFVRVSTVGYNGAGLWTNLASSVVRVAAGLAIAIVLGVPTGLAIGSSRVVQGLLDPIIEFYRVLPVLAYYSLLIIWFGIGETSKILVLVLAGLAPVILTTVSGVRSVRVERVQGARSLGLRGVSLFSYVIFPSCLPAIMTGIRVSFGTCYACIVAAEILGSTSGIGWMVWSASQFGVATVVIIVVLVIGVTGVIVDTGLRLLGQRLSPWVGKM